MSRPDSEVQNNGAPSAVLHCWDVHVTQRAEAAVLIVWFFWRAAASSVDKDVHQFQSCPQAFSCYSCFLLLAGPPPPDRAAAFPSLVDINHSWSVVFNQGSATPKGSAEVLQRSSNLKRNKGKFNQNNLWELKSIYIHIYLCMIEKTLLTGNNNVFLTKTIYSTTLHKWFPWRESCD